MALPIEFRLLIELDGIEFVCVQVWRKAGVIGVAFKGRPERCGLHARRY